MFSATLKPMYTWLSDYVAKLLASGLIKREKLMSGFTSPLNCQLFSHNFKQLFRFDGAKMGYNGRIKREKKSPAFMYPLNGMKQDCINYQMFIRNICCSQYQFSCLYIA